MPRDYRLYLEDILEPVEKIGRYLEGVSFRGTCGDAIRGRE